MLPESQWRVEVIKANSPDRQGRPRAVTVGQLIEALLTLVKVHREDVQGIEFDTALCRLKFQGWRTQYVDDGGRLHLESADWKKRPYVH